MRNHIGWIALVVGVGAASFWAGMATAGPLDMFVLEEHDRVIAESAGCFASCTVAGTRRNCTVKGSGCRAACTAIPECKADGLHPVKVCAVVR